MTGAATATVETLTAEVSTLVVNNRQVTLSIARQLDFFDFEDLPDFSPFGRVRTGRKGETFVRCHRTAKGADWWPVLPHRLCDGPCGHDRRLMGGQLLCGTFERLESREYPAEWVGRENGTGRLICVGTFDNREKFVDEPDVYSWFGLPLIVLAGLR